MFHAVKLTKPTIQWLSLKSSLCYVGSHNNRTVPIRTEIGNKD